MQVNDPPPSPPAGAAVKEEVRSVAEGEPGGRARSGPGFQRALERKRRHPGGNGVPDDAASAAAMAAWFRAEPSGPTGRGAAVAAGGAPRVVDRVLIGSGPDGAQARIRIGAGALAGTEIQLSSAGAGRAVEARLLTHTASSRQTLSLVMDEIRARLRDRGIVLSTAGAAAQRRAGAGALEPNAGDPAHRLADGPAGARR